MEGGDTAGQPGPMSAGMIPQLHIPVGPESHPYRAGAAADRRHFDAESEWAEWAEWAG